MRRRSLVEREIKQTRPFESSAVVPLISILRTANIIEREYNQVLEPHALTFQQFNVLTILRGARPDGHPVQEIAARLIAVSPGVTRLIDKLVRRGLVSRITGTDDRRQVICRITTPGLRILERIDAPLLATDNRLMQPLDDAERETLVELLDRLRTHVAHTPTPAQRATSHDRTRHALAHGHVPTPRRTRG